MASNLAPGELEKASLAIPQPATGRLRVLAVIPGDGGGSSFIFARRQIASLSDVGVDVQAFFLSSRTSVMLLREISRLRREIRRFRPHLIHAHYGTVTSFVCAAVTPLPLVITFRGSDLNHVPDVNLVRTCLGRLFSQISCLRSDAIICVSRQLRERLWWRRRQAVVISTGVDLALFRPQPKEQARASLGWERGRPIVVFHAGHCPRLKGLQFVTAALRVAEQVVGPIRLVNFDGSVPPEMMPTYLNAADCVVLASVSEGSPNIVKEALACNVPVVSTDVGDVAERLQGVYPSKVVRRDAHEFGKALADILHESRRSNGRQGGNIPSLEHTAKAIRSVYEAVLRRGSSETLTARPEEQGRPQPILLPPFPSPED
jgi:teichuronic acid biosynthesis glycosyltransferase TuaC